MKALTICQPFAHLIVLTDDDPRAKRVENRRWQTNYRGPLLIHAGKSREWLELDDTGTRDEEYDIPLADMTFGAIVGIAQLVGCVQLGSLRIEQAYVELNGQVLMDESNVTRKVVPDWAARKWPWLAAHQHTEGPYCWVLAECRRFDRPIPYRGAQGLFEVPKELVFESLVAIGMQ